MIYVGSKTGRDGIHGATMASEEFSEESEQKRPNVQVGDPFMEKLLLEACLEAMQTGAVVGIQDMGAAGLTCSTCEMGGRGGVGVEIELDLVPQRETGMTPYEIMLSESQERMLLVAEKGREEEVFEVFQKWGLDAVDHRRASLARTRCACSSTAKSSPKSRTPRSPMRRRCTSVRWNAGNRMSIARSPSHRLGKGGDLTAALEQLLASPNICSKNWITEQYESYVQLTGVQRPGGDAGVIRIKGSDRGLAMALDGNGRWCYLDPKLGAMHAVSCTYDSYCSVIQFFEQMFGLARSCSKAAVRSPPLPRSMCSGFSRSTFSFSVPADVCTPALHRSTRGSGFRRRLYRARARASCFRR